MVPKGKKEENVEIIPINTASVSFAILGTSPLILNRMSQKVRQGLLLPPKRMTPVEKATNLKHNPVQEYRDSAHCSRDESNPTRLVFPSTAFKSALRSVATDIPGAAKAQIGRLTWVPGEFVNIYGTPQLKMDVTRQADISRTPDIRTRAIVPRWAAYLTIQFVTPILREPTVVNLLAAAGVMRGIGDYRPEKGAGTYGQFTLVSADDAEFRSLIETGGMAAQDEALANPVCYDAESEELLTWFTAESNRRGFKVAA